MEQLRDSAINDAFHQMNDPFDVIYQFVLRYNDYINEKHTYGTKYQVTMTEAHTLTYIEENPGTTITNLATYWSKTKSALSQTVTKLVKKGLVERRKAENNAKTVLLFVTQEGLELSKAHKQYDTVMIKKNLDDLGQNCSQQEIEAFYKVMGVFVDYLKRENGGDHQAIKNYVGKL